MIIKDIILAGFKSNDSAAGVDFSLIKKGQIFSARNGNKVFLFKALLGVIYGMSEEEKRDFRDSTLKTFTGRVDLKFDDYILHIERDFETDIVAVLTESSNDIKPIFQGKDHFSNNHARPFMHTLEQFFSINDKLFLLDACHETMEDSSTTFGDLVDQLYLFIRPKFKLSAIDKLIASCTRIIEDKLEQNNGIIVDGGQQHAAKKLELIKNSKKIIQSRDSLSRDIKSFEKALKRLSESYDPYTVAKAKLQQEFPLLQNKDIQTTRSEVNELLELQTRKQKIRRNIQQINQMTDDLETQVHKNLLVYANLPDSFVEDFHTYQDLSIDLAQIRNEYDRSVTNTVNLQSELNNLKQRETVSYIIALPLILIASLFFLGYNIPLILGLLIVGAGSIFAFFRKLKSDTQQEIELAQMAQGTMKRHINKIESNIYALRDQSYLLDDLEYIDMHIERFKQYKKVQTKLSKLKSEKKRFEELLADPNLKLLLPQLESRYAQLLKLNPSVGLVTYIDTYILQKRQLKEIKEKQTVQPRLMPLEGIIAQYSKALSSLNKTVQYIEDYLEVEKLSENIDMLIPQFERIMTHFNRQNAENFSSN